MGRFELTCDGAVLDDDTRTLKSYGIFDMESAMIVCVGGEEEGRKTHSSTNVGTDDDVDFVGGGGRGGKEGGKGHDDIDDDDDDDDDDGCFIAI